MKASEEIDRIFFDKKFSAAKYMLRHIVGASDDVRKEQLDTVSRYRSLADREIAGVVDSNYSNFNASLGKFNVISNQLQEARAGLVEVSKRSMEGKAILTAKTKNLNELLLLKYESKKVIAVVDDIEFIDKAPSKIRAALSRKDFTAAVDIYVRAFELVLGENLAVFHAISAMRNALMESKTLIEDHLDAFGTYSKGLQQTVPHFEAILNRDVLYDGETPKTPTTLSASNPLQAIVLCVKRLSREVDVAGTLKNTRSVHLNSVVRQVAGLCRGKGFYEEVPFGHHAASPNFQSYLQVLLHVVEKILHRHALMVGYFNHTSCTMPDVVQKTFRLLQEQLGDYFGDAATDRPSNNNASPDRMDTGAGLFRFAQLESTAHLRATLHETASDGNPQVCPPSLFHVPVVYDDIVRFSKAVEKICASSFADLIFNAYLSKVWIPRLKSEAESFLSRPTTRVVKTFALPHPMDTAFNAPDVHVLLHIVDEMFDIMQTMPSYGHDIASIVELTVLRYVEECSAIVRKICEGTLNQLETGVAAAELMRSFQDYPVYVTAKGNVPHQPLAKVLPSETVDTYPESENSSAPAHNYGFSYSLPTPILTSSSTTTTTTPADPPSVKSKKDELQCKEWDFEAKFKEPSFWLSPQVSRGLLFDAGKLSMLAYLNMACDAVSLHIEECMQTFLQSTIGASLDHLLGNVKSASWRCSGLADECLFFLRRELRLHAFYFLTQVASSPLDLSPDQAPPTSPHDCIVAWNAHLLQLTLHLKPEKMAFLLDGLDRLEAMILMHVLAFVPKISVAGVAQMHVNVCALQQNLTALLYGYPAIPRDFYHFERTKRYYHLLTLSETELELYLMENRRAFPSDCLKSIWRVDVPTRVLTKSSVNKLDSLLR
ncbi:Aste57867_25169 [Aphanomyces stellatus]|uniref:Exocyst complex component Sec8 n=1 Tax=Aphanomyces stellatus TaxID=120398 RepID=A0A485LSH4_9STRA|nr:hypothetical protein As57867_025091 [Aphanomyces stellatus]VFU01798.1 Aste57867_25169 [Aphanomyces stellatus]